MKNGLLPIVLDAGIVDRLFTEVFGTPGYRLSISLEKQEVKTPSGDVFHFDIDSAHKTRLLQGLDDIGLSLRHANAIRAYENARRQREPWIFS
jgi:3-isopropylmalate/(R)-2-methylmalate dehydratase small subunit